jgi:catechol 2,3-dioxygenase-like lactoylglutathione lyase family enzyme
MDRSVAFYTQVLGLREVVYDRTGVFADLPEATEVRRVMLRKVGENFGAFSKLLGNVRVELIQRMDGSGQRIFEGRCWGDRGFIHLCFDAINLEGLKNRAESMGHSFTVDSADTFQMGKAGGRFAYLEDPDGTLLELVETHKVPILKSLGLYLDLRKRGMYKVLPDWMVRLMGWSKRND